jgi:hypothetical protein
MWRAQQFFVGGRWFRGITTGNFLEGYARDFFGGVTPGNFLEGYARDFFGGLRHCHWATANFLLNILLLLLLLR